MPIVMDKLGIAIVSTSKGVMTGRQAAVSRPGWRNPVLRGVRE